MHVHCNITAICLVKEPQNCGYLAAHEHVCLAFAIISYLFHVQVCFAFYGTLPALRANVHYYTGDERIGTDTTFNLQICPDWPTSFDGLWRHICINMRTCFSDYDREGEMFQVEKLAFEGGTFWVDEIAIAAGSIEGSNYVTTNSHAITLLYIHCIYLVYRPKLKLKLRLLYSFSLVTQTEFPVSPGGVQIADVAITGGYNTPPVLTTSLSGMEQDLYFGPIPMLVVSSFQVNYTVENCGSGISLLEGNYDQSNSSEVLVQRVQSGTPGITGTFDLSFNGRLIRGLPADIPGLNLDQVLEANFPNEGGRVAVKPHYQQPEGLVRPKSLC